MATKVIHGEGKPRIFINTYPIDIPVGGWIVGTGTTATSLIVTVATSDEFTAINASHGFVNRLVYARVTSGSTYTETMGKITAFDATTKTLTISAWTGGTPTVGTSFEIRDYLIDLPYCKELKETFTWDAKTIKLSNGDIKIKKKGIYYSAVLDYSTYATKDLVESLRGLFRLDSKNMDFFPRLDNPNVSYVVDIDPGNALELAQLINHQGHKYLKIVLIGTRRLPEANLATPVTSGFGDLPYGGNYDKGYGELGW